MIRPDASGKVKSTRSIARRKAGCNGKVDATITVPASALVAWAVGCLRALKLSSRDAHEISLSLVQTSLWGIDSHGIARLGHYLSRLEAGSIEARPKMRMRRTGPCTGQVDGGHGHGIVVCRRAMSEAMALAEENGIGAIGVANSTHCGAAGLYGRQAASAGLIGISFTHADSFVAPHGGTKKFLGTNPICITIPTTDPERPICLDMSTSVVPYNLILNHRREGRALKYGWAIDERGRPTIDPHAATCLLPMAGYKGYALAFMIELLCGPLNGMQFGPHIPKMYTDLSKRRRLGSFFIAIDPARFAGGKSLPRVATRMAREARAQPRANAAEPVLAPGDPEFMCAKKRAVEGIPIEAGLRQEIASWSKRLAVKTPWEDPKVPRSRQNPAA